MLPGMSITGPLAAGSYTFWSNETDGSSPWSYRYDFQVSAVSVPVRIPAWALVVLAAGLIATGTWGSSKLARRSDASAAKTSARS